MNHPFVNTLFHTIFALAAIYAGVPLVKHIFLPLGAGATTEEKPEVPGSEQMAAWQGSERHHPSANVPPINALITAFLTVPRVFATFIIATTRPVRYFSGALWACLRPLLMPLRLAFYTLPLSFLSVVNKLLAPVRFAVRVICIAAVLPAHLFISAMRFLSPLFVFFVAAGICGVVLGASLGHVVQRVQHALSEHTPKPAGAKEVGQRKRPVTEERAIIKKEQTGDERPLTRLRVRRQTIRATRKQD